MLDAIHGTCSSDSSGLRVTTAFGELLLRTSSRAQALLLGMPAPQRVLIEVQIAMNATGASGRFVAYGFADEVERLLFRSACTTRGVGPETALALLEAGEALDIARAVAADEVGFFTRVPGLGPKRAATLITQLRLLLGDTLPATLPVPVHSWVEARDALLARGADPSGAEAALHAAAAQGARTPRALVASCENIMLSGSAGT